MRRLFFMLALINSSLAYAQPPDTSLIQFVFTSDLHYGIARKSFRGAENVDASIVNAAMIREMNTLSSLSFPHDNGVGESKVVGAIDFVAITGDIANREEPPYQSAENSWAQFTAEYIQGLRLEDRQRHPAKLLIVPGNHDASNAIGYYKPMTPSQDASSMAGIYNFMFHPTPPTTRENFDYRKNVVRYSKDIGGIHFIFLQIWPDASQRAWMDSDLLRVNENTPVILFAHDPPDGDAKHFINPRNQHEIDTLGKFENLLCDTLQDDLLTAPVNDKIEQRQFVNFLLKHSNIKAYFHGHNNSNEYYTYKGPDSLVKLMTFRVDSPMKGKPSSTDETKLSFQVVSIDPRLKIMTVRECLWNTDPANPSKLNWGNFVSVSLK